jgi:hypothetical protein
MPAAPSRSARPRVTLSFPIRAQTKASASYPGTPHPCRPLSPTTPKTPFVAMPFPHRLLEVPGSTNASAYDCISPVTKVGVINEWDNIFKNSFNGAECASPAIAAPKRIHARRLSEMPELQNLDIEETMRTFKFSPTRPNPPSPSGNQKLRLYIPTFNRN